ncbi:MAG TPA: hypothetical protein VK044_08780, partial [Virgibacillus sp.]|nr:hypothetical protein [Virgibacillus sp.]
GHNSCSILIITPFYVYTKQPLTSLITNSNYYYHITMNVSIKVKKMMNHIVLFLGEVMVGNFPRLWNNSRMRAITNTREVK